MRTIKDRPLNAIAPAKTFRSVQETVAPIEHLALHSVNLVRKHLPTFNSGGREFYLPRYLFIGPKGGADPIRIGLFAGVHGNEPEGTFALIDFILSLEQAPHLAKDYCLFLYPIVNPVGYEANTRETAAGVNIPEQIWKNTLSPEVHHLQSELWMHGYDGIISLRTGPAAEELTIAIAGPIFARHLLATALDTAQDFLPQIVNSNRDALPKLKSVLLDKPNDLIRAAPGQKPQPFEIVITIPGQAPSFLQKAAVILLLKAVLTEYRNFIAFGANI
jgi:protein MpaA